MVQHEYYTFCLSVGPGVVEDFSHQYIELGSKGTLRCPLQSHFYAIFWYDSAEHSQIDPILKLHDGIKTGEGYISGEYDIELGGSLVIQNVSLSHERIFTCLVFQSQRDDPVTSLVNVTVTGEFKMYLECW